MMKFNVVCRMKEGGKGALVATGETRDRAIAFARSRSVAAPSFEFEVTSAAEVLIYQEGSLVAYDFQEKR